MECVRQDEGDDGKLWGAMRRAESCGRRQESGMCLPPPRFVTVLTGFILEKDYGILFINFELAS